MSGWRLELADRMAAFCGGAFIGTAIAFMAGLPGPWPVGAVALGAMFAAVMPVGDG